MPSMPASIATRNRIRVHREEQQLETPGHVDACVFRQTPANDDPQGQRTY